jgi:hypothetical protein
VFWLAVGTALVWARPTEGVLQGLRFAAVCGLAWEVPRWLSQVLPRWMRWVTTLAGIGSLVAVGVSGSWQPLPPGDRVTWTAVCCGSLLVAALWENLPRRVRGRE